MLCGCVSYTETKGDKMKEMKELWMINENDDWESVKESLKDAIELGFTGALIKKEFIERATKLGKIDLLSDELIEVKKAEDQDKIVEASKKKGRVFITFSGWKIIPLENIIAMKEHGKVIVKVDEEDEAITVLGTLEKGADGIVVEYKGRDYLRKFAEILRRGERLKLKTAKITKIQPLGVGDRVCIDTVTLMTPGEGMLIGNKAEFMFLVASESEESEYVASRPFRVNAGSVNAYIKVGEKTRYLSELEAGDEVEIVRFDGNTRKSYVGRIKIEKRPMILIAAESDGVIGNVILQNAETIKLITPEGKHKSISELKEGDEILVWVGERARHFGISVEEFIIER